MLATAVLMTALAGPAKAAAPSALTFDGQVRLRAEATDIESYASPAKRRALQTHSLRTRLGAGLDAGQGVKAYIQLQDSRNWGSEASVAANSGNLDLHQGYVDVLDVLSLPLDLRAGRMELQYGDQRLISPLDWHNVGRSWDGARLRWRGPAYTVDLFETVVKESSTFRRDGHFWGLYASCRAVADHEFDLYLLGRSQKDGSFTGELGAKGDFSDRTLGLRAKGSRGGLEYSGEGAWQTGAKAGESIRAWAAAVTAAYSLPLPLKPRVGLEYDFASGDSDPADGKVQTFDPLYAFGHAYQGYEDVFAWKNGHDAKASVSIDPEPGWRLQADYHLFRLAQGRDAWYDATGAQLARSVSGAAGKEVGTEVDLHVKGKLRGSIGIWAGWSRFFAGPFVSAAAGAGDRDWTFAQATFGF